VPIKSWPAAKFARLISWLQREQKVPVLFLAHASEQAEVEAVNGELAKIGARTAPIWLGRDGEVVLLAALLAKARFYVGHDTGAMHIAAALARPVVGIFGGGHWPRFRAVGARVISVVQPLPCFGCNWDCKFGDAPCIKTITTEDVISAVETVLDDPRTSYDEVRQTRSFSEESLSLIQAVANRYGALQKDRVERLHTIERLTREIGIRDAEIVALKREGEVKDRKVLAAERESVAYELELENLRRQPDLRRAEIDALNGIIEAGKKEIAVLENRLRAAAMGARAGEERGHLALAEADDEAVSLRRALHDRESALLKQDALVKHFQKSLAEKDEALRHLKFEARRAKAVSEEKALDRGNWEKALHDKDVHIRNLDAIIANLRNELAAKAAETPSASLQPAEKPDEARPVAAEAPPPVEVIEAELEVVEPGLHGIGGGTTKTKSRLRKWIFALLRLFFPARAKASRPMRHAERQRSESVLDHR